MNAVWNIRDLAGRVHEAGEKEAGSGQDWSEAFTQAFARVDNEGGGTVLVPPGEYLTGPLDLPSNLHLVVEKGARIRFSADPSRYAPVSTRWEGIRCHAMHPLLFARRAHDITIEGEGIIDGNGLPWWEAHRAKKASGQKGPVTEIEKRLADLNEFDPASPSGGGGRETQFLRPPLVQFLECNGIVLRGLTLVDSPFWTVHPVFSRRILIEDIRIMNPPDAPNTDGIDIDSCEEVRILDCSVDVGDDCIALKAGSGFQGLAEMGCTRNVSIRGCTLHAGHGGIVIGSETAGGIENVDVSDCRFLGSDRGIRLKSRRGRGGLVQNLRFANLVMERVLSPITINLYYSCGAREQESGRLFSSEPLPVTNLTPEMRNIHVTNLVATGCRASAGFICGLPELPIANLSLENCVISLADEDLVPVSQSEMYRGLPETVERGLRLRHVQCSLKGLDVRGAGETPVLMEAGARLTPSG